MAHAWKACWCNSLASSNLASSAHWNRNRVHRFLFFYLTPPAARRPVRPRLEPHGDGQAYRPDVIDAESSRQTYEPTANRIVGTRMHGRPAVETPGHEEPDERHHSGEHDKRHQYRLQCAEPQRAVWPRRNGRETGPIRCQIRRLLRGVGERQCDEHSRDNRNPRNIASTSRSCRYRTRRR